MLYHQRTPHPLLAGFVETVWYYEGSASPHTRERRLPNGCVELVINLDHDVQRVFHPDDLDRPRTFRGPLVSGAHAEHFVIDTTQLTSVLGVHFKPGGAAPFLGPVGDLRDKHVPLEALWGAAAPRLLDQVREAPTLAARLRVLEEALLARLSCRLRHPAVGYALSQFMAVPHVRTVAEVTDAVGLSRKRLIDVFVHEVGLTPKVFCRVRRFQEVLQLARSGRPLDWSEVALACGYFDQAHCNRDFRAFSGLSPSAYLRQGGEFRNHIPLPPRGGGGP